MRIKDSVIQAPIEGEILLLDIESGTYFGLTGTGFRIWEILTEGATVDQIVNCLSEEYVVEAHQLRTDVVQFIQTLEEKSLIDGASA